MYTPPHNVWNADRAGILSFMRQHAFALLVTGSDALQATHLPVVAEEQEGALILTAHLARANPQCKVLEHGEALIVFSGPHAYISPTLYNHAENVPTWNYVAVHAYGRPEVITDEAAGMALLEALMQQSEPAYLAQWATLSEPYKRGLYRGIVPFRMPVTRLEAKNKASQNKTPEEQARIVESLAESAFAEAREMATHMGRDNQSA